MFTGRLRSEIPTALVRISASGISSSLGFQDLFCDEMLEYTSFHISPQTMLDSRVCFAFVRGPLAVH